MWKLLGDVTSFLAKMPEKYCLAFLSYPLTENVQSETLVDRKELYAVAIR